MRRIPEHDADLRQMQLADETALAVPHHDQLAAARFLILTALIRNQSHSVYTATQRKNIPSLLSCRE